ncbi:MAG: saccharopine dehydrogenase [Bacteriovoracia bacterium]
MTSKPIFWLRHETKPGERRTPLTPVGAKKLKQNGADVFIESSPTRIFKDEEYKGCSIVPTNSWKSAPREAFILGIKELQEDSFPLEHNHIYFAHAYKGQAGAKELLTRFRSGQGTLLDLEYLVDSSGRRVAAFGYWAGFVGAVLGLAAFYEQKRNTFLGRVEPFESKSALLNFARNCRAKYQEKVKALVIGAKGRCGRGACEALAELETSVTEWDIEETKKGGPFAELLEHDLVVNCVLLNQSIAPFIDEQLASKERTLSTIADVSCDATNPHNPIRLYQSITTMDSPVHILDLGGRRLDILAIDHLPSLLPRESSEDFADQLLSHLITLCDAKASGAQQLPKVWDPAQRLFEQKLVELNIITHSIPRPIEPIQEANL